jgi:hypothetical protein
MEENDSRERGAIPAGGEEGQADQGRRIVRTTAGGGALCV